MNTLFEEVYIRCTADVIEPIRATVDAVAYRPSEVTKRNNLDGNVPIWLLVATLAANAIPPLLTSLATVIGIGRVKKIKVGDIEIENPTARDLEKLREILEAHSSSKTT